MPALATCSPLRARYPITTNSVPASSDFSVTPMGSRLLGVLPSSFHTVTPPSVFFTAR
jgi:hypothetical protein